MYCGHCNDLCRVSKCSICDQNLVGKAGRPEVRTCPSCGHVNEAKRISCRECECALIIPCPSCGKMNCSDHISYYCQEVNDAERLLCENCSQPLKQHVLSGRPVERREICQIAYNLIVLQL